MDGELSTAIGPATADAALDKGGSSEAGGRAHVPASLDGGEQAFARLLEPHLQRLQRLIGRRIPNPEDARDVLQDTRLAVWRALASYDAARPFEAWLVSIAMNKCRDWGRRSTLRVRLNQQMQAEQIAEEAWLHEDSPENLLIHEEQIQALRCALDGLPQSLLAPLQLTALQELSHADAGKSLSLTPKAVENRVRRARERLAQALIEEEGRDGRMGIILVSAPAESEASCAA